MNDTHDETEPLEVWCCPDCGDAYPDEDEAVECCLDLPRALERWQCRTCREVHETHEGARLCCYDEAGEPLPPSAAELEARGQMRLPAIA